VRRRGTFFTHTLSHLPLLNRGLNSQSLQSESKVALGSFVTGQAELQTRWEAQSATAPRWGAYLSVGQGVPREDIADIIAVLAYSQKKTKNNEEVAKAIGEAGNAAGSAVAA